MTLDEMEKLQPLLEKYKALLEARESIGELIDAEAPAHLAIRAVQDHFLFLTGDTADAYLVNIPAKVVYELFTVAISNQREKLIEAGVTDV